MVFAGDLASAASVPDTPASTAAGTIATGFTDNGTTLMQCGPWMQLNLTVQCTAGMSITGTNLADTTCWTIPSTPSPPTNINFSWGTGSVDGSGTLQTDGQVRIRSANAAVPASANIYATICWMDY